MQARASPPWSNRRPAAACATRHRRSMPQRKYVWSLLSSAPRCSAAVDYARVMTCRDPFRIDRVGLAYQVAELRERVAAHARNRRASARILADEIVDHVVTESCLEIDDVVRNAELLADAARVVDGIERAARAIGNVVAVTEQLHRCTDDVVALLDEQCRRRPTNRRRQTWRRALSPSSSVRLACGGELGGPCSTSAGNTSATRSTHSSVVSAAEAHADRRRMRDPGRTPMARSTWDGLMLPL